MKQWYGVPSSCKFRNWLAWNAHVKSRTWGPNSWGHVQAGSWRGWAWVVLQLCREFGESLDPYLFTFLFLRSQTINFKSCWHPWFVMPYAFRIGRRGWPESLSEPLIPSIRHESQFRAHTQNFKILSSYSRFFFSKRIKKKCLLNFHSYIVYFFWPFV